jgi:serine/threonine protein kinase/formylglycine-generating enzyme required for sulfatase activity
MHYWSITLHGPSGILHSIDIGESDFVLGAETGPDVFSVTGEGVAARHAWVSIGESVIQVEDLAGGTLVNGSPIEGRVMVHPPVSIQVGSVTVVIEAKSVSVQEQPPSAVPQNTECTAQAALDIETTVAFGMEMQDAVTSQVFDVGTSYLRQEEIGRGGMARIVSARDAHLERLVAVKVSTADAGDGGGQFLREADVLAKLAHPNTVPIYNRGRDELGRPFYSMKLVQGRTLREIIKRLAEGDARTKHEYSDQRLLEIFRKVCDGVEFAHSKGYLHRDLKPENVMVGEFGEVLVMDWGLAKVIQSRAVAGASDAQVDEPEKLSYIEGTPQYMSPEQAEGMYSGLDERSDIYSLGAILYAMLAKSSPVSGASVDEVLRRVRTGQITPFADAVARNANGKDISRVPTALEAVTLKAMAVDRNHRYASVGAFIADIEAYQGGFLTSAEEAGSLKLFKLWIRRNKVLAASVAVLAVVVSGFTVRVVHKGREASEALQRLRETAPTFAVRARDALEDGQFEEALRAATFAVELEPQNGEYRALRGNALQVLVRWPEALEEYRVALRQGEKETAKENLALTKELILIARSEGKAKAKVALFEWLNAKGRQYEAMEFGKELGDFWKERKKDLSALPELVKQLEAKLLPVPGTDVLLSKTEFTVGEWKLYLRAEGLSDWKQPMLIEQNDDHPVVHMSWYKAKEFCDWLSANTGKHWRLPTNSEWDAAVGTTTYPWGDYYPPHWDDGNYAILEDGSDDPKKVGVDGIFGTAPVGSFKANALGFYDLGGNAAEWIWDGKDEKTDAPVSRGGSFIILSSVAAKSARRYKVASDPKNPYNGFRLARELP